MSEFFNAILAKINAVIEWFANIFVAVFVAIWDVIKDAFSWLFESFLDIVVSAVQSIDTGPFQGLSAQGWGAIPGELLNILQLLGVGTAISIIAAAIAIRLGLQLIPFVRLGS